MGALKPWHIIVLVVVLILLFGAKRLPDAARSLGRSLRIIKAETKGLVDDDSDRPRRPTPQHGRQPLPPPTPQPAPPQPPPVVDPVQRTRDTTDAARPDPPWRFSLRLRRGPSNFERAADGSMTLIEHIRELRNRLFRASLAIVVGMIVGFFFAQPVFDLLQRAVLRRCPVPRTPDGKCQFLQLGAGRRASCCS